MTLFKRAHSNCQVCKLRRTDDVHHKYGRAGRLLLDERYWIAVCRQCHNWIGKFPAFARELGLIAEKGRWLNPP